MPPERMRIWMFVATLVGLFIGAIASGAPRRWLAILSRSPSHRSTLEEGRSKVEMVSPLLAPPFGATAAGAWQNLTRSL